jgi:YD repeat-containing protein
MGTWGQIDRWTDDALDRKLTEKQTVSSTMKTVSYQYDADGRPTVITSLFLLVAAGTVLRVRRRR